MNKYLRAMVCIPCGIIKVVSTKITHFKDFQCGLINLISPFSEITLDFGGKLKIGKHLKMRDGAKLRVRKGAVCVLGENTSINSSNIIACRERIEIGDNIQLSPNVQIYDHDHDFRIAGGIKSMEYKTAPIRIGNNVWIGCNSVILKGSIIGDNCVIGAGSIVFGRIPDNSIFIQKRVSTIREYDYEAN